MTPKRSKSVLAASLATRRAVCILAGSIAAFVAAPSAQATVYYWDSNGSGTAGFGSTAGTWGTSTFWGTDPLGSSATANPTILGTDDINFGTSTDGYTGTVSLSGTQTFNTLTVGSASGAVTIGTGTLTLNTGAGSTITNNSATQLIIGANLATGNLVKAGTGTLNLSAANNNYGTTTITGGILRLGGASSLGTGGAYANTISIGSGGTLQYGSSVAQTFSGVISGAGSLSKDTSATSTLTLSNTSTYTGSTTISAGTLSIGSSVSNGSSVLATSGITLSQGATLLFNAGANGAQSVAAPMTLSGGAGTASIKIGSNDRSVTLSGGVTGQAGVSQTLALTTGAVLTTSGDRDTLFLTGAIADGSGGTLGVTIDFAGASTTAQNAFVNLQGKNTFTGNLSVTNTKGLQGGATYVGAWVTIGGEHHGVTSAGATNSIGLSSGTGFLGAGADYSGTISISNGAVTGALTTLSFLTSANQILRGAISGTGSLRQDGIGTLTLAGTNNYTGTTTVSAGKLLITGNSGAANGAVSVTAGALGGNGGSLGGAVTVSGTGGVNLGDGSVGNLSLGSTLAITGAAGANNLSFDLGNATNTTDKLIVGGATSLTTAGAAVINLNQLGGTAGANAAASYTLIQGTTSMAPVGQFALATTKAFGQTFTLGVVGNDLQVTTALVTPVTAAAFWSGATTSWNLASNWKDALAGSALLVVPDYQTNVTFSATGATNTATNVVDADFDINSLNFNSLTGGVTIGGTKMLTLEAAAVNSNPAGNGINSANTSSTNTISAKVGLASSQTWTVGTGGTLAVSGAITDFGGGYALTKAGGGTLTLSGANTYSGGTVLAGGIVSVGANSNLGALTAGITLTANSQITSTAAGAVDYTRPIALGSSTLTLRNATANTTATFSGPITGTGGITEASGANNTVVNLSSTGNTFTGNVTLPTGTGTNDTLNFASIGDGGSIIFGRSSWIANAVYNGSADLILNTRSMSLATTFGFGSGTFGLDGGGSPINMFANNGTGTVTINSAMGMTTIGSSGAFFLGGSNTGTNTFAGAIADPTGTQTLSIGKWDVGKWILSNATNSYEGSTLILNGTLSVNKVDVAANAQPLGKGSLIQMGHTTTTGTLEYTGSTTGTTDKQVQIGSVATTASHTGGATILNNGSESLTFTNAIFNPTLTGITAPRTLTLAGTYTAGINEIQGVIQNNASGGLVALTKSGNGTWRLSGANTYSGGTTISAGTLALSGGTNRLLSTGSVAFTGAGTFDIGSTSQTLATITVPDLAGFTSTINGSGGTLTLNGASDLNWGPGGAMVANVYNTVVNLSGLTNFVYDASANTFRVGFKVGSTQSNNTTGSSTVTLAANNTITAAVLGIGDQVASNHGGTSILHLGAANTLKVGSINVGFSSRSSATLDFAAGSSAVTIRNTDGSSAVASWNIGSINNPSAANYTFTDSVNLSNGTLDALVTSMTIGSANINAAGRAGTTNASFTMGASSGVGLTVGTMTVGEFIGSNVGTVTGSMAANGTFTLNSASGIANITTLNLATNTTLASGGTRTVSGTFNLTNGTLNATTVQKGDQTGGTATATLAFNWANGTIGNRPGTNLTWTDVPITLSAGTHTFDISGSSTATLNSGSVISGNTFGITKSGTGTLTLAGANTYSGATSVNDGTLLVSGSLAGSVDVAGASSLLGGGGSIGALTVGSGGTVAPGDNGPGKLTVNGAMSLDSTAHLSLQINGTTAVTGHDQLAASGNITLGGDLAGSTLGFSPSLGTDVFIIILNSGAGTTTGTFNGVAQGGSVFIGGQEFQVSYFADSATTTAATFGANLGNDVALLAVPEPGALVSLLGGFVTLLGFQRRRRA